MLFLPEKERFREGVVEKFNQRTHKKCCNQRTDARKQAGEGSDHNTEQIAADPDKFKRKLSAFRDHNGNCIVHGDTQIRGHIQ